MSFLHGGVKIYRIGMAIAVPEATTRPLLSFFLS
jgi:hypothetical protein